MPVSARYAHHGKVLAAAASHLAGQDEISVEGGIRHALEEYLPLEVQGLVLALRSDDVKPPTLLEEEAAGVHRGFNPDGGARPRPAG